MKKFIIPLLSTILIVLISGFSCGKAEFASIAKKEFTVEPFTSIEIGGPFNVYIRQGETEQVYVEADERIINKLRVNTSNGTLVVETEPFSGNVKRLNVYITLVKVNYMKFYDAGNIECKGNIKTEDLRIDYSRTGNMSLGLDCKNLNINSKGTGNVDLSGSVITAEIHHSGIGNFDAGNLKTETLKISVSGVGNTEVYASKEIYINASGVGNLTYSGGAKVKEYNVSGVGNVSGN